MRLFAAALLTVCLLPSHAVASPIALFLFDNIGNSSGFIIDNSAQDADPSDGIVAFSGVVGDWSVLGTIGQAGPNAMSLSSFSFSAQTTSTLGLLFTSLDQIGITNYGMDLNIGLSNGTLSYAGYADASNAPFGLSTLIGFLGPYSAGSFQAFTGQTFGVGPFTSPYSLTQLVAVEGTGDGVTAFVGTATMQAVPEPATFLLLLGPIAAGAVGLGRRFTRDA